VPDLLGDGAWVLAGPPPARDDDGVAVEAADRHVEGQLAQEIDADFAASPGPAMAEDVAARRNGAGK
jgi:hypothetical protein